MSTVDRLRAELQRLRAAHPWRPGDPPLPADVVESERRLLAELADLGWTPDEARALRAAPRGPASHELAEREGDPRGGARPAPPGARHRDGAPLVQEGLAAEDVYTPAQLALAQWVAEKIAAGEVPSKGDPCAPGACPNCEAPQQDRLFCSDLCKQIAQLVRYCRKKLADGQLTIHADGSRTWADPLVERDGYQMRLAMVLGGGYPENRKVPPQARIAVLARDGHRCALCGSTEALEIDHIAGSSPSLDNLQVLCKSCNGDKARDLFMPALAPAHRAAVAALWRRIETPQPARVVDDSKLWEKIWRKLQPRRPRCRECGARGEVVDGLCPSCLEEQEEAHAEARAEWEWEQTPEGREFVEYLAYVMQRDD